MTLPSSRLAILTPMATTLPRSARHIASAAVRPRAGALPTERSALCQAECYAAGTELCDRVQCWAKRLESRRASAPGARRARAVRPRIDVAAVYRERNRKGGLR
jgi:hypothetical protein